MAQLVARLVRNEKVRGSNPLSSTSTTTKALPSGRAFVVSGLCRVGAVSCRGCVVSGAQAAGTSARAAV
jgi:hypothetical protein